MARILVVMAVALACGCRLKKGETRCTTSNVYGTAITNCKTGTEEDEDDEDRPPPPPQPTVFWCTTRQSDGFGYCTLQPGDCENARAKGTNSCKGSPGNCTAFSPCSYQAYAICASSGCFVDPASCARAEQLGKRNASACVLRR